MLAGCSDLGDALRPRPLQAGGCDIEPAALDFGDVPVRQSAERTFTVTNRGTSNLSANITSSCPEYAFVAGGGASVIARGETLIVQVRFTPSSSGPSGCTIRTGLACAEVSAAANGFVPSAVSFAADIQPILTNNCVPCHGPPVPQNHMNLSEGVSYANLVNVVSFEFAPAIRVVPSDTAASVVYHKIYGDGRFGPQMPFGGSLQTVERNSIRDWILEGARNN